MKLIPIGLFLFLTSCVAIQPYVEPKTANTAKIEFKTNSGGYNLKIQYAPNDLNSCNCASPSVKLVGILHNKAIGMGNYADKGVDVDSFSINATAGTKFRFVIDLPSYEINSVAPILSTTATFCQAHQEFIPEAGKSYQVLYDGAVSRCSFSIYEISASTKKEVSFKTLPPCVVYPEFDGWVEKDIRNYCKANQNLYK